MDLREGGVGVDPWTHWYYSVKADALVRQLKAVGPPPERIVDVGAGTGFFSEVLLRQWPHASSVCIDLNYEEGDLARSSRGLTFARSSEESGDTYLFMDVLEHVEDDLGLLSHYVRSAPPGARFYLTVPAFKMLWSNHDVYLHHFRRYRLAEIERVARSCGLEVLAGRYLYGASFPAVAAVRIAQRFRTEAPVESQMRQHSRRANATAKSVLLAENRLPGNRVAGSTAAVFAVKPGHGYAQ